MYDDCGGGERHAKLAQLQREQAESEEGISKKLACSTAEAGLKIPQALE